MWGTSPNLPISRTSFIMSHSMVSWDRCDKFRPDCEGHWMATNWFNRKCTCIKWDTRFKILGYTHVTQVMNMELLNISRKKKCCFSSISLSPFCFFLIPFPPTLKKSSSTGLIINRFWHQTTCMWMNPGSATTQHIIELLCSSMSSSRKMDNDSAPASIALSSQCLVQNKCSINVRFSFHLSQKSKPVPPSENKRSHR